MLDPSGRDTVLWISDTEYSGPNKGLQIRGFTPEFDYSRRNSLLYSLGATSVHNFPYYSVAYFECQDDCFRVIRELHQRILFTTTEPEVNKNCTTRLKVEFVHKNVPFDENSNENLHIPLLRPINPNYLHTSRRTGGNKLDSSKFVFPDACPSVSRRICDIILNDKAFYYDVLLLMIQHNLKPPFDDILPSPGELSNSSTANDNDNDSVDDDIPAAYKQYYKLFKTKHSRTKRPALKTGFLGSELPQKKRRQEPEKIELIDVFDKTDLKLRKPQIILDIPLPPENVPSTDSPSSSTNQQFNNDFGKLTFAEQKNKEPKKIPICDFDLSTLSMNEILTEKAISENRISHQDWSHYPVFVNYSPGEPSQSLYIKNLNTRKVNLKDLYCIFTGFININDQSHKDSFNIILIKSGKLRGQAFISFPSIEIASNALRTTNGYLLYNKPIVVAFSRKK